MRRWAGLVRWQQLKSEVPNCWEWDGMGRNEFPFFLFYTFRFPNCEETFPFDIFDPQIADIQTFQTANCSHKQDMGCCGCRRPFCEVSILYTPWRCYFSPCGHLRGDTDCVGCADAIRDLAESYEVGHQLFEVKGPESRRSWSRSRI